MTNTMLLKNRIKDSGFKLKHLACKLGISRAALSMKINNRRCFSAKEMFALSDIIGLSDQERRGIFFAEEVDK